MGTDSWLIVGYIAGILLFFAFKLILRYFEPIKEEDDDNDDFFLDAVLTIVWPIEMIILIIYAPTLLLEYVNCQGLKRQKQQETLEKNQ